MTTTEMINLLKANERGGVTGRSRTLNFYVNGHYLGGNNIVSIGGSGDGLITDLDIEIKCDRDVFVNTEGEWISQGKHKYKCSACYVTTTISPDCEGSPNFCMNCGATMTNVENVNPTLSPCPFCKKSAAMVLPISELNEYYGVNLVDVVDDKFFVICNVESGGCGASTGKQYDSEEDAIKAWNRSSEND